MQSTTVSFNPKNCKKSASKAQPKQPNMRYQFPPLEYLDACGFKTNVKTIREGDWICMFCQNLNFSFRSECNRCQANASSQLLAMRDFFPFQVSPESISAPTLSLTDPNSKQQSSLITSELFSKLAPMSTSQEGFSNVVFIDFEVEEGSEGSSEEFSEEQPQKNGSPLLEFLDD